MTCVLTGVIICYVYVGRLGQDSLVPMGEMREIQNNSGPSFTFGQGLDTSIGAGFGMVYNYKY